MITKNETPKPVVTPLPVPPYAVYPAGYPKLLVHVDLGAVLVASQDEEDQLPAGFAQTTMPANLQPWAYSNLADVLERYHAYTVEQFAARARSGAAGALALQAQLHEDARLAVRAQRLAQAEVAQRSGLKPLPVATANALNPSGGPVVGNTLNPAAHGWPAGNPSNSPAYDSAGQTVPYNPPQAAPHAPAPRYDSMTGKEIPA